jgi:hypothetical protein
MIRMHAASDLALRANRGFLTAWSSIRTSPRHGDLSPAALEPVANLLSKPGSPRFHAFIGVAVMAALSE